MQTATVPVIDAAKLQRHTMGDAALQVEVLSLFAAESERLLRQVEEAPSAEIRAERLQAIAGVARNIGALRLAQAAKLVESQISSDQPDLEPLRTALSETLAYIRRAGS